MIEGQKMSNIIPHPTPRIKIKVFKQCEINKKRIVASYGINMKTQMKKATSQVRAIVLELYMIQMMEQNI